MRIIANILFFFIFLFNISSTAFPIPDNKKVIFDIIRKNKIIGTHEILFNEKNGYVNVETNIYIEVKILFVTAYKFSHTSTEVWQNEKFLKLDGYTDFEDEREYYVKGEIKDNTFFASGMDGEIKLNKNLIPSNFWNQEVMYQEQIFDTQKGIVRKLDVREKDTETIMINDKSIDCLKFILNATRHPKDKTLFPEYTLWYSKDKELMKFKFRNPKDKKMVEIIRKQ